MKKFVTLFVVCCCAAAFAGDLEIKNVINKSKIGASSIASWGANKSNKLIGTGVIIQGSEKDEKAFKITSGKVATYFYSYPSYAAKAGDKIKISAEVKGKGTCIVGFYSYNKSNKFIPVANSRKFVKVDDKKQEIEAEFVITNGKKGEIVELVRPCIAADANSEVIIEDLEFEIDYKDR